MGVSRGNKLLDSDFGNAFMVGVLTMALIIALESAFTKVFLKSKKKSTKMVIRREILSRLSGFRAILELFAGIDFSKEYLLKDCEGNCKVKNRQIEKRRLILPIISRVTLLLVEIVVIALSGETLVSEGNGTIRSALLVPINDDVAPIVGCRNELPPERSTASEGTLETCTTIVRSEGPGAPSFEELEIEMMRNYGTNDISFTFGGTGGSKYRRLHLTTTYQSHDQLLHTMMPFEKVPNGWTGVGFDLKGLILKEPDIFQINILHEIYNRLASALGVSDDDKIQSFVMEDPIGNDVLRFNARFRNNYDFDQDIMVDELNAILLNQFKLQFIDDQKLVALDPRSGNYGPERGDGPFVFQQNMVPWWVWVILTFVFASIAAVFDRLHREDPEFYLFRAFVQVTSNDTIAGPLAMKESEFYFGKYQKGKDGRIGYGEVKSGGEGSAPTNTLFGNPNLDEVGHFDNVGI